MRQLMRLVALQLVGSGGRTLLPLLVVVLGGTAGLLATGLRGPASPGVGSSAAAWWVALATAASLLTTLGWPLVAATVFWHHVESCSRGTEHYGRLGITRRRSYLVSALTGTLLAAGYSALALLTGALAAILGAVLGAPGTGLVIPARELADASGPVAAVASPADVVALAPIIGTVLLVSTGFGLLTGTLWRRWRWLGVTAGGVAVLLLAAAGAVAAAGPAEPTGIPSWLPAPAAGAMVAVAAGVAGFLLVERPDRGARSYRRAQVPEAVAAEARELDIGGDAPTGTVGSAGGGDRSAELP